MPHSAPDRIRLAVIGAGLGSAPHFKSLQDLADQAQVMWLHVRHPEQLRPAQIAAAAQVTARLEDILDDARVQGVLVLTPPNSHLEIVQRLARAGKHVLLEKPLEINPKRATELVQTCETQGVRLAVMLQHRMREAASTLRRLLAGGELGQVVSASMNVRWWRPQSYYDEPGRGSWARDGGGVLITQAIHTLDVLLSLLPVPERVTGHISTSALHRMEAEDSAAALLQCAGGVVATLQATTAAYPGFTERIELNCTQGSATLEGGALQVAFLNGKTLALGASQTGGGGADPMAFDHGPHRALLQDFVAAIREGREPAVTGRSALRVHQVIDAIVRSSQADAAVLL